jgi:hypothetical protein
MNNRIKNSVIVYDNLPETPKELGDTLIILLRTFYRNVIILRNIRCV